jgi:hypothetical protein
MALVMPDAPEGVRIFYLGLRRLSRNISYLPMAAHDLRDPFRSTALPGWTDIAVRSDQWIDYLDLIKATRPREGDDNEG